MKTRKSVFHQASGSAFLATLILLVVITGLVAAALTSTSSTARFSQRSKAMEQALVTGDGALQMLYADWRAQSRDNAITNPLTPLASFTSSSNCLPTATEFPRNPLLID